MPHLTKALNAESFPATLPPLSTLAVSKAFWELMNPCTVVGYIHLSSSPVHLSQWVLCCGESWWKACLFSCLVGTRHFNQLIAYYRYLAGKSRQHTEGWRGLPLSLFSCGRMIIAFSFLSHRMLWIDLLCLSFLHNYWTFPIDMLMTHEGFTLPHTCGQSVVPPVLYFLVSLGEGWQEEYICSIMSIVESDLSPLQSPLRISKHFTIMNQPIANTENVT